MRKPSEAFMMPKRINVMARSSSINNSFANGIVPVFKPSDEEIVAALETLGMTPDTVECAYCGDPCTQWDHLNPLVADTMPTGYVTEIRNLVPCCGSCNQSKGNRDWREWIVSDAPKSPTTRGVADIAARMARLERYEEKFDPIRLDIKSIVGEDLWGRHWRNRDAVLEAMRDSMAVSSEISRRLREHCEGLCRSADDEDATESDPYCGPSVGASPSLSAVPDSGGAKGPGDAVSNLVRGRLVPALEQGMVSEEEVGLLQSLWYSKEAFGLSFPVLRRLEPTEDPSAASKDHKGRGRYYVRPIYVRGQPYLVCSQWYQRNRASLETWLAHHRAPGA